MTKMIVFPGQGSQRKGMGADLFKQFPKETQAADALLGYSMERLCLEDPDRNLRDTRFTQPALFVVNALTYLAWRQTHEEPLAAAGHSLGEYNALFAAGVLDFETGLRLVKERGALMAQADAGGMAAVVGLAPETLRNLLESEGLQGIDIANLNTPDQITIAGLTADLARAEPLLRQAGARFMMLNVSAAFHSRYMRPAAQAFRNLLDSAAFQPARFPVIANVNARPYPEDPFEKRQILADQICGSVHWYETVSYMLTAPRAEFEELGPGNVLTKMVQAISAHPLALNETFKPESEVKPAVVLGVSDAAQIRIHEGDPAQAVTQAKPELIYMYTGLGSQYFQMGAELFAQLPLFRARMEECSAWAAPDLGFELTELLYHNSSQHTVFDDLPASLAANLALGWALTKTLEAEGQAADLMLGYGSGELTAAVCAGALSPQEGLRLAVLLGQHLLEVCAPGAMLAVFGSWQDLAQRPELLGSCQVVGHNAPLHHILAGEVEQIGATAAKLKTQRIPCQALPVTRALHHAQMAPAEAGFLRMARDLRWAAPHTPLYSPASLCMLRPAGESLWQALRQLVRFDQAVSHLDHEEACFVELGPSSTLAGFVGYHLNNKQKALGLINRFGRNLESLDQARRHLATLPRVAATEVAVP